MVGGGLKSAAVKNEVNKYVVIRRMKESNVIQEINRMIAMELSGRWRSALSQRAEARSEGVVDRWAPGGRAGLA